MAHFDVLLKMKTKVMVLEPYETYEEEEEEDMDDGDVWVEECDVENEMEGKVVLLELYLLDNYSPLDQNLTVEPCLDWRVQLVQPQDYSFHLHQV